MKITKLDPHNTEDTKPKLRISSSSRDKVTSTLGKKKIQINVSNIEPQLIPKQSGFNDQQRQGQFNQNQHNGITSSQPLTHSKKAITGELLYKQHKQSFMDFLQNHMKNQTLQNNKNKIKLPLIASTKLTANPNNITDQTYQETITPDIKKFSNTKNVSSNQQTQQGKASIKQNPIFINIKAVIPMQKMAVAKKKDYSLRDLRLLKKERQNQNDCVIENDKSENNQNQRCKVNTVMARNSYIKANRQSPLKITTGQKRTSNQSSLEKISSAVNTREKKSFSINQNKKKYATTYYDFCVFISSLNKIKLSPSPIVLYKAFVGKGNNSILIKNAIKNRFWWNIVAQKTNNQEVNFVWSQQRDNEYVTDLGSFQLKGKKPNNHNQTVKKQKYHLQSRNQDKEKQPATKEFTRYGLARLLSEKELKQNTFTPLYAQTMALESISDCLDPQKTRIHNHLEFNWNLTNKKALFYNLKTYYQLIKEDPFKFIPLTFHVKQIGDQSWDEFKLVYQEKIRDREESMIGKDQGKKKKKEKKQKGILPLWIIKPGENSNQGCGIQVSDSLQEIIQIVKQKTENGKNRSSIIQRYLMPFLYNKRKFDIRCYMLTTSIRGQMRGYWYEEGYIRTSSKQFTTKNLKNRMIHLTNDAVQKKSEDYGKYENGNKISFADFQKYLDNFTEKKLNFYKTVYPKMMKLAKDALTATHHVLDAKNREFTFEVFGLDFMIDEEFQTWLIQVNNNPCLELSSPLLARIIPNMIENAFKIAIDPIFPPPLNIPKTKNISSDLFESNKFTLVFSSGDMEQGFQHSISQNKVNLDQIIEGEQQDEQLLDDEEDCEDKSNSKKELTNSDSTQIMMAQSQASNL